MKHGYVSITPLRLDLTNGSALDEAKARIPLEPVGLDGRLQPAG
jgi:hypothetical protein